jgi:integrase/recombinase XerD
VRQLNPPKVDQCLKCHSRDPGSNPGLGAYQSGINPCHVPISAMTKRALLIQVEAESWDKVISRHIEEELPELSARRRYKIRNTLEIFARQIKKHPNEVTRQDLESFFDSLKKKGLKLSTIRDYKIFLKRFYKNRKGKKFTAWIKVPGFVPSDLGPEDLISQEEHQKMLAVCENLRDKAIISALREGDFRPEEFLTLKRKDVTFDQYGAIIHIEKSKTFPRPVRLVVSAPFLANWMENHPLKNAEATLWPNLSTSGGYRALCQTGLRRLVKRIAGSAKIEKRIWPYLFRHTRNTELSLVLAEAPWCKFAGWKIGSRMPRVYVHLSGGEVDESILLSYGIKKDPDKELKLPKPCARCNFSNDPSQDICTRCGAALSLKAAIEQDEKDKEWREKVEGDLAVLKSSEFKILLESFGKERERRHS